MSDVTDSAIESLRSKIETIRFGMLTNTNSDQGLSSRPMTQQALDDDGTLWFFTSDETQLVKDLHAFPKINVSFANPSDSVYVTVEGDAQVIKDRAKIQELWNPMVAAWFPEGIDDPHLSLIKVSIHYAEYWDAVSNKMLQLFAMAKAAITGEKPDHLGEHRKIVF